MGGKKPGIFAIPGFWIDQFRADRNVRPTLKTTSSSHLQPLPELLQVERLGFGAGNS